MTRTLSAPWATAADLPLGAGSPPAPWTWSDLLGVASEVLFEATGRRWRGEGRSHVQIVGPDSPGRLVPGWVPWAVGTGADGPSSLSGLASLNGGWGRGLGVVVKLPSSPVTRVVEVSVGSDADGDPIALPTSAYRWTRGGLLERLDGSPWPSDGSLLVTFDSGAPPPTAGRIHAVKLALELAKVTPGYTGGVSSELANVVTSVAREGVTVQAVGAVNLREAITSGWTGIAAIDAWIAAHRGRRGRVFSPDLGRARSRPVPTAP